MDKLTTIVKCIFGITLMITSAFAAGQEQPSQKKETVISAKSYSVRSATSDIKVDGVLDERAWEESLVGDLPYEWLPGDNIPAPVDTEFLITFSKEHLYIAFRCFDPDSAKIRAHLMDRDDTDILIQDDHISVMLDTFNDERRGFQFRVNPLGVQADANFSEMEGYEDFSWDAIWASDGKIYDWGYAIEMAIPFNQLRFPSGLEVQTWGFSAERSYPRNVRHRMTSHKRRRDINCILCQHNKITGFQGMKTGLNFEADPTLTTIRTDELNDFPNGKMEAGKIEPDPGLTLRWGITPNLILNGTVNPDFSQVEADVAQMEVNTRFALQYPEKRPFFLEGADFFLTPIQAVFTRTVADPDGGIKFTGKVGKSAFGFFGTYDKINNLLFPTNQGSASTSLEQGVAGGVFRYRMDLGQNSAFGMLYTGRIGEDYYNHLTGLDGFFRISRTKTLNIQFLHSESDYPDDIKLNFGQNPESIGGNAIKADFFHNSRNWIYGLTFRDLSPDFRADFGYVPRVDVRELNGHITRVYWGKRGGWFNRIHIGMNGSVLYDYEGKLTDRQLSLDSAYMGPLQSTVMLRLNRNQEFYVGKDYQLNSFLLYSELKPVSGLRFNVVALYGDSVDYQNFRKATGLTLGPFAEFNLGRHINIKLRHNFQRLDYKGEEIFTANLSQVRFIYNFNVRMFVRFVIQYMDISRNTSLFIFPTLPKTQTIFSQFLFSYKLNPKTVLFLGYSDNYLGMTNIDIKQTDRTFFVKLGYAWTK